MQFTCYRISVSMLIYPDIDIPNEFVYSEDVFYNTWQTDSRVYKELQGAKKSQDSSEEEKRGIGLALPDIKIDIKL